MSDELAKLVRNSVRERISAGGVAISMVVRLVQSIEIVNIAKASGFDALYVDLEHSPLSLETTSQICIAALDAGIAPLVRVPTHGPEYVSRVLDGGALGVIAPHVGSAAEARNVVRNAKFPPLGERSVTAGIPHLRFRNWPIADVRRALNEATMVIAMIESAEALENVEEIAAVEGVDILMIGTNDLCADLGIDGQFEHEQVAEAYARTIAAARKHGKVVGLGGLASRADLIAKYVSEGAQFVSSGSDLSFILAAGRQRADEVRDIERSASREG